MVSGVAPVTSKKTTDSPAPRLVMPDIGTLKEQLSELSSILKPVMFTGLAPRFDNSNQSATAKLPLASEDSTSLIFSWAWAIPILAGQQPGPLRRLVCGRLLVC